MGLSLWVSQWMGGGGTWEMPAVLEMSPGISPACCLETVSRLQRRRVELLRVELGVAVI